MEKDKAPENRKECGLTRPKREKREDIHSCQAFVLQRSAGGSRDPSDGVMQLAGGFGPFQNLFITYSYKMWWQCSREVSNLQGPYRIEHRVNTAFTRAH